MANVPHVFEVFPEDEQRNIELIGRLTLEQLKAATAARDTEAGEETLVTRDAHAKGHACVSAQFIVDDALPLEIPPVGLFRQTGHAFDALIRFSSGSGTPRSDRRPDGRGIAVKVLGVEGPKALDAERLAESDDRTAQDFLMIGFTEFFVRNAREYVAFTEDSGRFFKAHPRALWIGLRTAGLPVGSPELAHSGDRAPTLYQRQRAPLVYDLDTRNKSPYCRKIGDAWG